MTKTRTIGLSFYAAWLGIIASFCSLTEAAAADLDSVRSFNIAPQRLETALIEFSRQSDLQVLGATETLADTRTQGVHGNLTSRAALTTLLEKTSIAFNSIGSHSIQIVPAQDKQTSVGPPHLGGFRLAQAETNATASSPAEQVASETPASAHDGAARDETSAEVTVTGTRLTDRPASVPVTLMNAEALSYKGTINVADALVELPQAGTGTTRTNSNFSDLGIGSASINLRNLGANRTLVLVNGRRFVPGFAGSSAVDLNSIPTDFIDRVEVVTGGASALYGSEAIAGVVNFILKDRIEGLTVRAQGGRTSENDDERDLVSLTGGTSFGPEKRGHVALNVSWDRDAGLRSADREISSTDRFLALTGPAAYSSFAPQGRFELYTPNGSSGTVFTFDKQNQLVAGFPVGYGFNRNPSRRISLPVRRDGAALNGSFELSPQSEFFVEGTYSKVRSNTTQEPYSFGTFDIYSLNDPFAGIPITNAYIPAPIQAQIAALNGDADPNNDIVRIDFRRRQNEVYDRSTFVGRETYRAAVGFRGDVLGKWHYDVAAVYGELKDGGRSESVDDAKYRLALDSIVDPGSGQIVCRDAAARAAGCVPVDLFGYGTVTPEAAAYVTSNATRYSNVKNQQTLLTGYITGKPLALPAGDLGVAFGAEYRKEKSTTDWDPLTNGGSNTSIQYFDLAGDFDVWETFLETNIPLLAERPGIKSLNALGSVRYSDYSSIGSVMSWNAGLTYAPVESLRLRGVYARANRAPNISELFSAITGGSVNGAGIVDPCNGVTATSTGPLDAACRAIPGVLNTINTSGGTFAYSQADFASLLSSEGGNPNLDSEQANTLTFGMVLTPAPLPGLRASVDYFDIKVTDAIRALSPSIVVEQCLRSGDLCNDVFRLPTGKIKTVSSQLSNVGAIHSRGVDLEFGYRTQAGTIPGSLEATLLYTRLLKLEQRPYPSAPLQENVGQLGGSGRLGAGVKHKATGTVTWRFSGLTAIWQFDYLSPMKDQLGFAPTGPDAALLANYNSVPSTFYHNIQLRYAFGEERNTQIYFGVDNLFDKAAPLIPNGFVSSILGTETASDVYDVYGRRFYLGAQLKFGPRS